MKLLYIHGFGSKINPNSEKIKYLERLGSVKSIAPDYTMGFDYVFSELKNILTISKIDMVVGTSMGGYFSILLGNQFDLPSVAINPVCSPSTNLKKYIGIDRIDHYNRRYTLDEKTVSSFPDLGEIDNKSLVLIDLGDDVIDVNFTLDKLKHCEVHTFDGGSHRFDHMCESLDSIENYGYLYNVSNGF